VFAGKDASRALAKSSVKEEDALPEWSDLSEKEKGVLNDWYENLASSPCLCLIVQRYPSCAHTDIYLNTNFFVSPGLLSSASATTLLERLLALLTFRS
jgi:hypothetical protein